MRQIEDFVRIINEYNEFHKLLPEVPLFISKDILTLPELILNQLSFDGFGELLKYKEELGLTNINKLSITAWTYKLDDLKKFLISNNFWINEIILDKCSTSISESELIALNIETNKNIILSSNNKLINKTSFLQKCKLIKEFSKELTNLNLENITTEDLKAAIIIACSKAVSSDNIPMNLSQGLKILTTINLSFINNKYNILQSKLMMIYSSLEVENTVEHLQIAEDLHFYLTKINEGNTTHWKVFLKEQKAAAKNFVNTQDSIHKAISFSYSGINAFINSLEYIDQNNNMVYAAFISNELWKDYNILPIKNIEMFISVLTSKYSEIVSHAGIARAALYEGEIHKNLSLTLHSSIAKIMLNLFPDKTHLILTPTPVMRDILLNVFKKQNLEDKFYIGHSNTEVPYDDITILSHKLEWIKTQKNTPIKEQIITKLIVDLKTQADYLNNNHLQHPITFEEDQEGNYLSFTLKSPNGEVIREYNVDQICGEINWLFKHKFLVEDCKEPTRPLITVDYKALASMQAHNPNYEIEHYSFLTHINPVEVYTSQIQGETITY